MIKAEDYIYRDIYELNTPAGKFSVTDGEKEVAFSVVKNSFDVPYEIEGKGSIRSNTNYSIEIPVKELEIGKIYTIQFSDGIWEFCDSDEHTVAFSTVINGWAVGIGAYDPCDFQKEEQMWAYSKKKGFLEWGFCQEPPEYDESVFSSYSVSSRNDNRGFDFKVYDDKREVVWFNVAWIQVTEYSEDEYSGALGLWLC